jgi:hypothetical protein
MLIHNVTINYIMVAVQCAMSATSLIDLFLLHGINSIRVQSPSLFLSKTVRSQRYIRHIRTTFIIFSPITRKCMPLFQEANANNSRHCSECFQRQNNKQRIVASVDHLKPYNFFWWGMAKDQTYSNIPRNKDSVKEKHTGCSLQLHQQNFNTQ